MTKRRFGLLLSEREALALREIALRDGESRATVLRRLLRAEAERRGIKPEFVQRQGATHA